MEPALTAEKQLLAHAPPKDWRVPAEAQRCYEDVLSRFLLPREVRDLLVFPETMDLQMLKLMKAFKLYPDDYPKLILMIRNNRGVAEGAMSDEILIRMYGMENARNFLLAIAITQQALGKKFEWEKEAARPKVPVKQILQHALKAQHSYQGRAVDFAFASGLIFDILALSAQKTMSSSIRMKSTIEETVEQSLLTAKIGLELSRRVADLRLVDFVYSACVLRCVGRIVAGILREETLDFAARAERDVLPLSSIILSEETLYGVSTDFFASLICSYFPLFKPIQEAIYFQRKPYLLQYRGQKDLANLAMTVCLASQMAQYPLELADEDDPLILDRWLRPEVKELGLTSRDLFQVSEKLKQAQ